jgi:hypothetical protein
VRDSWSRTNALDLNVAGVVKSLLVQGEPNSLDIAEALQNLYEFFTGSLEGEY